MSFPRKEHLSYSTHYKLCGASVHLLLYTKREQDCLLGKTYCNKAILPCFYLVNNNKVIVYCYFCYFEGLVYSVRSWLFNYTVWAKTILYYSVLYLVI